MLLLLLLLLLLWGALSHGQRCLAISLLGSGTLRHRRLGLASEARARTDLAEFGVRAEVVAPHADDSAFALAALNPFGSHNRNIHFDCAFPFSSSAFRADEVRGVDADAFDEFCADAFRGAGERGAELGRQGAWGNGYASQVGHFMRTSDEALGGVGAGGCEEAEVECIFCVHGQAGDFRRENFFAIFGVSRYDARLGAVTIEGEGAE